MKIKTEGGSRKEEVKSFRNLLYCFSFRLPASAFLLGCTLAAVVPPLHAQQPDVVRIGFASPLTGPQAHYGQDNVNGARMAIDDLNAQKFRIRGQVVRFELVVEDDKADPLTGTVVAQR